MTIDDMLDSEGPVFSVLDKIGQMILLSVVWFLGCLPIVTAATSTTALYYAVIKSIRRDYGSAMQEFWSSYKANIRRGVPITVLGLLAGALLGWNISLLTAQEQPDQLLLWGSIILLALLAGIAVYICPVLSRFSMGAGQAVRLAFVMAVRFWYFTLVLIAGTVTLIYLQIYVLPIPTAVLLPSGWCYVCTFMAEKALRRFMPPKEENDDSWYYQ